MAKKPSLFSEEDIVYTEKINQKKLKRDFLANDRFAGKLSVFFGEYLLEKTPTQSLNHSKDLSFMFRRFQENYKYLVETEGWSDRMVRTIIWNICLNKEEKPYNLYTFFKYEDDYYNSKLVPYDEEEGYYE